MSFACPSCGTDYARKLARMDTLPAKVRCHRCGTVWHPAPPRREAMEPLTPDAVTPRDALPPLPVLRPDVPRRTPTGAERPPAGRRPPPSRLVARGLWAAALLLLAFGIGSFGYAYRDQIPFLASQPPIIAEVHPSWTEIDGKLHLAVAARAVNEGAKPAAVDRVRVKFLSPQGAWVGEVTVRVGPTSIPSGGAAELAFTVDEVPDGTASLEFILLPSLDPAS